jgi:hypothetical protein
VIFAIVLRVMKVFPQAQWTVQAWYLGWIFGLTGKLLG